MDNTEHSNTITEEAKKLLHLAGIEADILAEEDEEGFSVRIDTDENALLIGKHGNTLVSLENILSLIMAQKLGEYKRIVLEVGDYRKDREQYLKDLATRLKEEVLASGNEKTIRGLKSWERRLIHVLLQDDSSVTTESHGEGRDRVLVIMKK